MKFEFLWQKLGRKPKSLFKTNDPCLVHGIAEQAVKEKEKIGKKVDGNIIIKVKGEKPNTYLLVKNGKEDKAQGVRFVGEFF
jgi:hypothetical protein